MFYVVLEATEPENLPAEGLDYIRHKLDEQNVVLGDRSVKRLLTYVARNFYEIDTLDPEELIDAVEFMQYGVPP